LVQYRQEIRVVVDAVLEGSVRMEDLDEEGLAAALPVGAVARVPSACLKTPRFAVAEYAQPLRTRIRDSRRGAAGLNAIEVFAERVVLQVGTGWSRRP
jgi:hypothetical protein